jgi:hypothetical protein
MIASISRISHKIQEVLGLSFYVFRKKKTYFRIVTDEKK